MESIWSMQTTIESRPSLPGELHTDVAVIGAGMAGLLTAYLLRQQGTDVIVLEAEKIAGGQTKNTTAKITSQHRLIYHTLIEKLGRDQAALYAKANQQAIEAYRDLINTQTINCHFEDKPAFVYALDDPRQVELEVTAAQKLGINASYTTQTGLPFRVRGAARFEQQAQFNPLEFLREISRPLTIYEHTMAQAIEGRTIITAKGKVHAKKIVVATHYPFLNIPGFYFMRMHQERSYVIALENAPNLDGMYIDADENGYSFRNYENTLLLGGGGHRTGENSAGGRYEKLRNAAQKYYPDSTELAHWSAQDCFTLDNIPYIGPYCITTPHVYVASGFHKWGMTGSMVAAQILSDEILNKENPYRSVFSPQRFKIAASLENMLTDGFQAAKGLTRRLFQVPDTLLEDLPCGHGGVVEYEGEKLGVYKDQNGKAFIISAKCPHLGCQLEWNPDELSWDCPCHGSRFDYQGNLLDNPAMESLREDTKTTAQ